jgi:hypothetical protein
MANYSVTFARSARKELEKLHPSIARRILQRIEALATIPDLPALRDFRVTRIFGEFELETIESFIASMTPLGISTFRWFAIEAMRIASSDRKVRLKTDIGISVFPLGSLTTVL